MSRSFKKTPIVGIAGDSDKQDKRLANRRCRRITKEVIKQGEEGVLLREVSNVWDMDKDGKIYVDHVVRK